MPLLRATRQEATRFLVARADEAGRLTLSDGRARVLSLEDPGAGPLMALYGRAAGRTLLAVHSAEVFEIDVDAAITALGQSPLATAPAAPGGPSPSPTASPQSAGSEITESRAPPPRPTARPTPTATPVPTVRPRPTATPVPTARPLPTATPVPRRPAPAVDPAANELIDLTSVPLAQRMAVQIALQRRGLYSGAIDGIIGPGSRAGISAFQRSINAPDLGRLTRRQFDLLRAEGER